MIGRHREAVLRTLRFIPVAGIPGTVGREALPCWESPRFWPRIPVLARMRPSVLYRECGDLRFSLPRVSHVGKREGKVTVCVPERDFATKKRAVARMAALQGVGSVAVRWHAALRTVAALRSACDSVVSPMSALCRRLVMLCCCRTERKATTCDDGQRQAQCFI